MNKINTILSSPECIIDEKLLNAFRSFSGNDRANFSDLYSFLTLPTAEREEFYAKYCTFIYQASANIIIQKISVV